MAVTQIGSQPLAVTQIGSQPLAVTQIGSQPLAVTQIGSQPLLVDVCVVGSGSSKNRHQKFAWRWFSHCCWRRQQQKQTPQKLAWRWFSHCWRQQQGEETPEICLALVFLLFMVAAAKEDTRNSLGVGFLVVSGGSSKSRPPRNLLGVGFLIVGGGSSKSSPLKTGLALVFLLLAVAAAAKADPQKLAWRWFSHCWRWQQGKETPQNWLGVGVLVVGGGSSSKSRPPETCLALVFSLLAVAVAKADRRQSISIGILVVGDNSGDNSTNQTN